LDSRIVVDGLRLSEDGRRIDYQYTVSGGAAKYFEGCPTFYAQYETDISSVPESLLMIPLVANLMPIAWFAGIAVEVQALDEEFVRALENIKITFQKDYPFLQAAPSSLTVGRTVQNSQACGASAMLFSGGVDAYTTFFRHQSEGLELVSVHGADIAVDDHQQWQRMIDATGREALLDVNVKRHVQSNIRDFYNYRVDLLVPSKSWWGTVQHGLALNSLLAPLSHVYGYSRIYIASSYTDAIQILWGSTPEIDNQIKWAGCKVFHDGYEMHRVNKIASIVKETSGSATKVKLRVCYSELNNGLNCSNCEKCFRTMLALSLFGADPNQFGFRADSNSYATIHDFIRKGFKTLGARYFWWEIYQRMEISDDFYCFSGQDRFRQSQIREALAIALEKPIKIRRFSALKMAFISRFPSIFAAYLGIRRRFL
jgi:hypothetical protein